MQIVLAAGASQYCHHERGRRNESKIRVCDHQFPSCRKNLRQRVTNSSRFFEIFPYPNFIPLFPFLDIKIHIYISFVTPRGEGISFYTAIFSSSFSKVGLIFQSRILLPPLFFLASSIPPFNSKPPRNLLFIHTPSEKLFIAFTSRNLPLSLSLFTHPRKTSSKFYPLDANARTPFPRYSASPLLPLTRNHDKTRISIFRVIAPLAFRRNRRFPFNRSPFDNGEIFPREKHAKGVGSYRREDAAGPYYRLRERVHRGRGLKVVVKGIDSINKKENMGRECFWAEGEQSRYIPRSNPLNFR